MEEVVLQCLEVEEDQEGHLFLEDLEVQEDLQYLVVEAILADHQ